MIHNPTRRQFVAGAAALGAAAAIPGCSKGGGGGSGNDGFVCFPTLHYFLVMASTNLSGVLIPILTNTDKANFQNQSGQTMPAGKGFVYGVVRDAALAPVAGAQVQALNDNGTVIGTVIYRTNTGFNGITSTNGTGQFIIFNLDPGRINLRVIAGATGNLYITTEADGCTSVNLSTQAASGKIALSGVTRSFANLGGSTPLAAVNIGAIGFGSPFALVSDGVGNYATPATSIDPNTLHLLRLTKGGTEVTTFNYVKTLTSDLAKDLMIVTTAERASTDFTPATVVIDPLKGMIRGKLTAASGGNDGYVVQVTTVAGAVVGTVHYGDSGNNNIPGVASQTDTSGIFYVYNVDPGTVLIRATKTNYGGGVYADVAADCITFLDDSMLKPSSLTQPTVSVTGSVLGFMTGALSEVTLSFRGLTNTAVTNAFGGFGLSGLPANSSLITKTVRP